MASKHLNVLIAGQQAGTLEQSSSGALAFSYLGLYGGTPLSTAMPVSNHVYGDKRVRPFLFGLLPDDPEVRRNLGAEFGVSGNNPFALLEHVGLDCPGAVQFCTDERLGETLSRAGALEAASDQDIARRLAQGRIRHGGAWTDLSEHWSLGGQQSKFALRLKDGAWYRCLGSAATTHILKGGISTLEHQALNEFVCMRLADACGIPAARVAYRSFADEQAIVIERYDRVVDDKGNVARIHQEDLCQALGVLPENKYPEYGGPSAADAVRLLKATGDCASRNLALFTQMLFFNYLIGAPDAHAKNYSMLFGPAGEAVLAPLYDVASALPYARPRERLRTAMGIGGENRVGHVGKGNLDRYVQQNRLAEAGLDEMTCRTIMAQLAKMIPEKLSATLAEADGIPGIRDLGERLEEPIATLCRTTLELL